MPQSFDLIGVEDSLAISFFSGKLHHFEAVTSTNQLALEAAQAGAPHGSVWVADEQTAGRGRGGHSWHSSVGDGLYVSILLRPEMPLERALWLSLATGLAAQAAIAAISGRRPDIRWPNDLLFGPKKCGGILVETAVETGQLNAPAALRHAVIGIGINVNHERFPFGIEALATSLREQTGVVYKREALLIELLRALEQEIVLLESELDGTSTAPGVLDRFSAASTWVQAKRVSVDESGGYTGVTAGLDSRGFLRVAGDDGVQHTVLSGGVRSL